MASLHTRREALALGSAAIAASHAGAARPKRIERWAALTEAARTLVARKYTPGLQIAVARNGRQELSEAFGYANLETLTPMTTTSVLRVGSLTKQFTAAGILRLIENGKLTLDSRLATWMPSFPRASEVTVRHLLNHTSGIRSYTNTSPPTAFLQNSRLDYDAAALEQAMTKVDPLYAFVPGASWEYSNTGYVLLGLIIEEVSGSPLATFLGREVIGRAGLHRTAIDNVSEIVVGRASGYSPSDTDPPHLENASFTSMSYPGGAGALRSSADDLCQWQHALLTGKVIGAESLKAMLTPGRLNDGSEVSAPDEPGKPRIASHYGFGIAMGDIDGHAATEHIGSIQGFGAWLVTYREPNTTFAIIVNTDDHSGELMSGVQKLHSMIWQIATT
jgi:D-alanyl-D-alanine carboxypeptidase